MSGTKESGETSPTTDEARFTQLLQAIAQGVASKLQRTLVANVVTIETIRIARMLRIPDKEIQEWRASRCWETRSDDKARHTSNLHPDGLSDMPGLRDDREEDL